jgi:hypothetical protein
MSTSTGMLHAFAALMREPLWRFSLIVGTRAA